MNKVSLYSLSFMLLVIVAICMWFLGFYFMFYDYLILVDWEVISINSCVIVMTLLFDWMSLLFMSCVMFISSMVIFYSSSYMHNDIYKIRFLILVLMFVFSMLMMIMSPNMISILIGWDGLGLVSYLLVIYFQNYSSHSAGMLTILTNRIGDAAILLSIAWMVNFGSWNFIYYLFIWEDYFVYLLVLLVLAGFTKSAQIPFSSWLPAAMAAPTPVSALVHSSTLVTAGVYLLIRFSSLFSNIDCWFLIMLSLLTMFMSGLGASFEFDLKKIIALSTLSQLGLMMSILFLGYSSLAFFHLLTHAFFKALLFLCAGLIIHCMSDSQDIRYMGGVVNQLPFTSLCFCISSLSLCGFPFLAGFYSKDIALEMFVFSGVNIFNYLVFLLSVGLTVCYSFRLVYYCMSGGAGMYSSQGYFEEFNMIVSMIFLVMMAVISGSLMMWSIVRVPYFINMGVLMKVLPLLIIIVGSWVGYELSFFDVGGMLYTCSGYFLSWFLGSMWFMPKFSTYMVYSRGLSISHDLSKNVDMGWGEFLISKSWLFVASLISMSYEYIQNNNIKLFMLTFFFILLIMVI